MAVLERLRYGMAEGRLRLKGDSGGGGGRGSGSGRGMHGFGEGGELGELRHGVFGA